MLYQVIKYVLTEADKNREKNRINKVYFNREVLKKSDLYGWHIPTIRYQEAIKSRMFSKAVLKSFGKRLSQIRVLDVGCGTGGFLRRMVEWGADPGLLLGTEFLEDRLQIAMRNSPPEIRWRFGGLDFNSDKGFDLVSAHTVFSSVLDDAMRSELAESMWQKTGNGGWVMVFDFRYNNPSNPDVRKVTRKELETWWPGKKRFYLLDMLAPPLARRLVSGNYLIAELLVLIIPFLRSHFVYMAKK